MQSDTWAPARNRRNAAAPIFIGGLFKSGTSLFRAMISQHSRIAGGLETQWFHLPWDGPPDRRREHIDRLTRFFELEKGTVVRIEEESRSAEDFLSGFMAEVAASQGKTRWAEKTPGNILHLKRIFTAWPDASVIHVVRDPRDVLASLRQARKWDDVETFTDLWCRFLGAAEDFKQAGGARLQTSFLEVRYEDLVLRPKDTMKKAVRFLEETWEEAVADFAGRQPDYEAVLEITGKASTTLERLSKPLTRSRVGIWRKTLEPGEWDRVRALVDAQGLLPLMDRIIEETPGGALGNANG